jgi:hypothetical protein
MVGAVILSRATAGDALSDEFLSAAREQLAHGATSAVAASGGTSGGA